MNRRRFLKAGAGAVGTATATGAMFAAGGETTASATVTTRSQVGTTTLSTTSDDGTVEELILNASGEVDWANLPNPAEKAEMTLDVRLADSDSWDDLVLMPRQDVPQVKTTGSAYTFEGLGGSVLKHTTIRDDAFVSPTDGETATTEMKARVTVTVSDGTNTYSDSQVHDVTVKVTNAKDGSNGGSGGESGGNGDSPSVSATTRVSGSVK